MDPHYKPMSYAQRSKEGKLQVGSQVITHNSRRGTVVRIDKDDLGEYLIVKLDQQSGEFAYDIWEINEVQEAR